MNDTKPLSAAELVKLRHEMTVVIQPETILLALLATIDALDAELTAARKVVAAVLEKRDDGTTKCHLCHSFWFEHEAQLHQHWCRMAEYNEVVK